MRIIALLALLVGVLSCDETVAPLSDLTDIGSDGQLINVAVGNRWTYIDAEGNVIDSFPLSISLSIIDPIPIPMRIIESRTLYYRNFTSLTPDTRVGKATGYYVEFLENEYFWESFRPNRVCSTFAPRRVDCLTANHPPPTAQLHQY